MNCQNCYKPIELNTKTCPHCGHTQALISSSTIIGTLLTLALFFTLYYCIPFPEELASLHQENRKSSPNHSLVDREEKDQLIEKAQETVYTIYTKDNQGSGFLYDKDGHIITNAHVVEGSLTVLVKTQAKESFTGHVIGYSNKIDLALIKVNELKGERPFEYTKKDKIKVGEEVVALGTPLGLEGSATFGYITGVDRNFNIPPHTFENVYQISAPIKSGNSGGPLIATKEGKIIGINAAKSTEASNVAYSIPMHQVIDLIEAWIDKPLSQYEITSLFYNEEGDYYFHFLRSLFDYYYFDGGHYLDDENFHQYWFHEQEGNKHDFECYFKDHMISP